MLQLESWLEACLPLARMRKQQKELGELLVSMDVLPCTNTKASQQNKARSSETGDADTSQKDDMVATAQD